MRIKKLTVSFFVRGGQSKSQIGTIYAKVTYAKKSVRFSTNIKIKREHFKQGRIVSNKPSIRRMQKDLETIREKIFTIYSELIAEKEAVTADDIAQTYLQKTEVLYLIEEMEKLIEKKKNILSKNSYDLYKWRINTIQKFFIDEKGENDIPLQEFNETTVEEMKNYYLNKGYKPYSINQILGQVKTATLELQRQKKIKHDPFLNYKKFKIKTNRTALNIQELEMIKQFESKIRGLNATADIFVFMCYTGTSISDTLALKKSDIYEYKGKEIIDFKRIKTETPYIVPLLPEAKKRMEKYLESDSEYLFPRYKRNSIYANLQKIKKQLGLKKKLSAHIARHTFATTICLDNGIDLKVLSTMLGHTSVSTTEIYGKIQKDRILEDMSNLDAI